jgi:hypothetical protein
MRAYKIAYKEDYEFLFFKTSVRKYVDASDHLSSIHVTPYFKALNVAHTVTKLRSQKSLVKDELTMSIELEFIL